MVSPTIKSELRKWGKAFIFGIPIFPIVWFIPERHYVIAICISLVAFVVLCATGYYWTHRKKT